VSKKNPSSKMTLLEIGWEVFLFAVLFLSLFFIGIKTEAISEIIFSNDDVSLATEPIRARDRIYGVALAPLSVDDTFFMAGSRGKIWKTTNSGQSFKVLETPTSRHLQDIAFWDEKRAVAVGDEGVALTTDDGGTSWNIVKDIPKSDVDNKLIKVTALDEGRAFAVGVVGAILYTEDYGKTWVRKKEEEDISYNDVFFIDENEGWVVGEFATILKTEDGGDTWTKQDVEEGEDRAEQVVETDINIFAIAAKNDNFLLAAGTEGTILTTKNGGKFWQRKTSDTSQHLLALSHDDSKYVGVGNNGIIFTKKGDADCSANRLAENELAWHTDLIKLDENQYIIVGQTSGIWNGRDWKHFN